MFLYLLFASSASILDSNMGEDGGGASDDYDPHGDPKADPRERRRIRYEYRELIAETQRKKKQLSLRINLIYFGLFFI